MINQPLFMLLFCSSFTWRLYELRSQASQPCLGFQCWDSWVLCFYNAGFRTGSSCELRLSHWWDGGCTRISYSRFFSKQQWIFNLFVFPFGNDEHLRWCRGHRGDSSLFLDSFCSIFFIIWGHLLPLSAMGDSRYCSFLPVPPNTMPWSQHSCLLWFG